MKKSRDDERWMRRALRLAARGFTHPNPMVGCVIVNEGKLAGEGYHPAAGMAHAEVYALTAAGDLARGATAYVTLEPCSHWGRTPPCVDALIAAGVARVVAAHQDPDARVAGTGFRALSAAGIQVEVGVLAEQAAELNAAFIHFHNHHTPYTILKAAMSLDGKIATACGDSKWITAANARRHAHILRARSGAVMAGIGTVLADNPQLTTRLQDGPLLQPLRVVVDSRLRTPPESKVVQVSSETSPLLIATTLRAGSNSERPLTREGVEILRLPEADGGVDLCVLMKWLAERGITSVLVEGGGELSAAILNAGLAQSVLYFIAPILIGGRNAITPLEGAGARLIKDAVQLAGAKVRRIGSDFYYQAAIKVQDDRK